MRLFRQFILRSFLEDRLRSFAAVLGIALGIAVVVAVHLANASSFGGFEAAVESIAGKTSLEIVGTGPGLDETLLSRLDWLSRFGEVSPVIEGDALAAAGSYPAETIRILGVDILSDWPFREYHILQFAGRKRDPAPKEVLDLLIDPQSIIVTEVFARRHGIGVGSEVELTIGDHAGRFVVRGLLLNEGPARALGGNFALMDIAAAQAAFARLGRLDRIDVRLAPGLSVDDVEQKIASRLPSGLSVERPARRGRQVEKMLRAFQFNLTALSYIALLVGLFLIYNTVSISVISRREEIGMLRALGASRKRILFLFLGEAAGLSALGCGLGVLLGRILAAGAVRLTSTTVTAFYITEAAAPARLALGHVLLAFAVGVPLSLAAAALPAAEAARAEPTEAAGGTAPLKPRYRLDRRYIFGPPLLLVLALALTRLGPVGGLPLFGYAAAVAVVFAGALLVPSVLHGLAKMGNGPLARVFGVEGLMANANLTGSIGRLSISISALAVALAMMAAIAVMIGSFRATIITWVGQTLQADLYIRPATRANTATDATISPAVEAAVRAYPSVAAVDRFLMFDAAYEGDPVIIGAGEFPVLLEHGNLSFKAPADGREEMKRAAGRDAVVVSESFALKHHKEPGDFIVLPTPAGPVRFRIAAVFYDYSNDRGTVIMDRPVLLRYFGARRPTNLNVYLKEGADPDAVRSDILSVLGSGYRLLFYTNASLRKEILRVFDSTFSITYALEVIAIFIAIFGVASTLMTLMLERRRELSILRLVGAGRRQIRKAVVIEAGIMGLISQGVGIAIGMLLSLILIYVINVQSFGWTIRFHLPAGFLARSSVLILLATALSGLYPAGRAGRLPVAARKEEE